MLILAYVNDSPTCSRQLRETCSISFWSTKLAGRHQIASSSEMNKSHMRLTDAVQLVPFARTFRIKLIIFKTEIISPKLIIAPMSNSSGVVIPINDTRDVIIAL